MIAQSAIPFELYRGKPVSVAVGLASEAVEGLMGQGLTSFLVGDREVKSADIRDLRLVGTAIGPTDESGHCRLVCQDANHDTVEYVFSLDCCDVDFPADKLEYGEFKVEVDCHLGMVQNKVAVSDVRFRKAQHVLNRKILEGQRFLYRLKTGSYFPAFLIWDENDDLLLRRYTKGLDGEDIPVDTPIVPEEIEEITRCPKSGSGEYAEEIQVQYPEKAYEGILLSAIGNFFVLKGAVNDKLYYSSLPRYGLRFIGKYHSELHAYNKKYQLCPQSWKGEGEPPARASFVVGVNQDGLVAKWVRPLEAPAQAESFPELSLPSAPLRPKADLATFDGFIYFYSPEKQHGFISKEYPAPPEAGVLFFHGSTFSFSRTYDPGTLYAVHCTYNADKPVKPGAVPAVISMEVRKSWPKAEVETAWVDEDGEFQVSLWESSEEEYLGFILSFNPRTEFGWIGKTYPSNGKNGEVSFRPEALQFSLENDKTYAVRCTYVFHGRKKQAKKVELVEAEDRSRVRAAAIDESSEMPVWTLTDEGPLSKAEALIGKEVDVICREKQYHGYLWRVEEKAILLGPTSNMDISVSGIHVSRAEITQIWAYGFITHYFPPRSMDPAGSGYGYIDQDIFFNIRNVPEELRSDVEESAMVRFRVVESCKAGTAGTNVRAPEVIVCQKQTHEGIVVGSENGIYQVTLNTERTYHCVPFCCLQWPGKSHNYIAGRNYRVSFEVTLSSKNEYLGSVIRQVLEDVRDSGYVKFYSPNGKFGFLVDTRDKLTVRNSKGPKFSLWDVASPDRATAEEVLSNRTKYAYIRVQYRMNGKEAKEIEILEYPLKGQASHPLSETPLPEALSVDDPNFLVNFNSRITTFLQREDTTGAEQFLEQYRDHLQKADYLRRKWDILSRQLSKSAAKELDPAIKKRYVECVDERLSLEDRMYSQMLLLRQRGDMYYRCGTPQDKEKGDADYRRWLELYPRVMEQLAPEKRENYKKERSSVEARLAGRAGATDTASPEQSTELRLRQLYPWWIRDDGDEEDNPQYLWSAARLEEVDRRYKGKKNDKSWLKEKEAALTSGEKSAFWELAWVRSRLYSLTDEEDSLQKWYQALANALLADAWEALRDKSNEDLDTKRRCKCRFLCVAALEVFTLLPSNQTSSEVSALYFASVLLSQGQLNAAVADHNKLLHLLDEKLKKRADEDFKKLRREGAILFCHVQRIDPEDLSIFKDLREEEKRSLKDSGVTYSQMIRDLQERVRATTELSVYIKALLDFWEEENYKEWLEVSNSAVSWKNDVYGKIKASVEQMLEKYPTRANFDGKSQLFTEGVGTISPVLDYLRKLGNPADKDKQDVPLSYWVIWDIFQPLVRSILDKYMETFSDLCATTRPSLQLVESSVIARPADGGYQATITLKNEQFAGRQTAYNVVLSTPTKPRSGKVTADLSGAKSQHANIPAQSSMDFTFPLVVQGKPDGSVEIKLEVSYTYTQGAKAKTKDNDSRTDKRAGRKELTVIVQFSDEKFAEISDNYNYFKESGVEETILDESNSDDKARRVRELLRNRESSVKDIMEKLGVDSGRYPEFYWVSVYGQWRVGKTTILNAVAARLKSQSENLLTIKFECPSGKEDHYEDNLAQEIFLKLKSACDDSDPASRQLGPRLRRFLELAASFEFIDLKGKPVEAIGMDDYYRRPQVENLKLYPYLADFITALSQEMNIRVVLLLDEFTNAYTALLSGYAPQSYFDHWGKFLERGRILAVTAGGEFSDVMFNTYASNKLTKSYAVKVDYLSKKDCDDIIDFILDVSDEHPRFAGKVQKDHLLNHIYKLTQGSPHLLVQLCAKIRYEVNRSQSLCVTEDTLNNAIGMMTKPDPYTHLFKQLLDPFSEADNIEDHSQVRELPHSRVREANKTMLEQLVLCASRVGGVRKHSCTESALRLAVTAYNQEQGKDFNFDETLNELLDREVLLKKDGWLRIKVDLCYEVIRRLQEREEST